VNLANTAWELLAGNLPAGAERLAVVDGERRCTYGELERRAAAVAAWLTSRGVRRGDRVGIHLRKSLEEVVGMFAVWRAGAVAVDVSHQWTAAQLDYVLRDCGVKALVTDARHARDLEARGLPDTLEAVLVAGDAPTDATTPPVRTIDRDLAAIMYTSGSTGMPKGVMLSHQNLVLGARSVAQYLRISPDDRLLSLLPLCFDYGLNQVTSAALVGASVVLQAIPMPSEIAKTIANEGVTGFAAVPPTWVQLVPYLAETRTRLPSLRYVTNSGGKIPQSVLERMPEVFPGVDIVLMYGLTEAFRSTWLPPEKFAAKAGAMGQAIPNAECWVVDPDLGVCGPGQEGELVHRGALVSLGYWGRPEDTAAKIRPCAQLAHLIGDEPVVWSGDIVRVDEDGDFWFVGRRDGMIKCSGFRLSPTEVEEIAHASALVGEAVAFGVEDEALGEAVHLVVTPAASAAPSAKTAEVDIPALERYFRSHMPHYMVPRAIHVRATLPRTASGKIDRPQVVAGCRAQTC
jgi:acyl-CoA ligase (AMP-forming) (exosortase A-associated)